MAFYHSEIQKKNISLAFKGMNANFLKRAESTIRFVCSDGKILENMVLNSIKSGERQNESVTVYAINEQNENVAIFEMIVSLKVIT